MLHRACDRPDCLQQVQGRVPDLAMSHTASRVIQACAKHGNEVDRQALLDEAAPRVVDLAKSAYGNLLLIKLVTEASKIQFPGELMQSTLISRHIQALLPMMLSITALSYRWQEYLSRGGHTVSLRHSKQCDDRCCVFKAIALSQNCIFNRHCEVWLDHCIVHASQHVVYQLGVKPA